MTLTFISNNGSTWPLDGSSGVTALDGLAGLYTIPEDLIIDQRVASDGGVLASQRKSPRPIDIPLLLSGSSEVLTLWGQLVRAFAAGGTLEHDGPNGVRQLRRIVLQSSTQSLTGHDISHSQDEVFVVSLLALDPWWYGPVELVTISLDEQPTPFNDATVGFSAPIPFNGGTSTSVNVAGDAPAFPVFAVAGGFTDVTVTVEGLSWRWERPMASGEVGQVDTRPGSQGPRMGSSIVPGHPLQAVDWSLLAEASRLVTLPVGTVPVVVGATSPDSSAELVISWEPRWLTP